MVFAAGLDYRYVVMTGLCALPLVGEEFIKKLLAEQKLVPNGDARLITDWLVRGRYPIVIGLSSSFLPNYQKEGLGTQIEDERYIDNRDITGKLADVFQQTLGFIVANTRAALDQSPNISAGASSCGSMSGDESQTVSAAKCSIVSLSAAK